MAIISKVNSSQKISSWIDGLKMYALAALTYDIRRFIYNLTLREVFKYIMALSFIIVIPILITLSFLALIYSGYLFWDLNPNYTLWLAFAASGVLVSYLFFYFAKRLIFLRSKKISNLLNPPSNPVELFISRIVQELKKEQLEMMDAFKTTTEPNNINIK